jgi:two-component system, response regulator RegA
MMADPQRILVVDDDVTFVRVLMRALTSRGFLCDAAYSAADAMAACERALPDYVVLDLKLGADNGLNLIGELRALSDAMRIVLLTGYASLATAVEAIKRGADDYLAKPVDADAVLAALINRNDDEATAIDQPRSSPPLKRLEWEHIQRVMSDCDGNVSEAARRLHLHRRTLQRKLAKRPQRETVP